MDYQAVINELSAAVLSRPNKGHVADYIPQLAVVDPEQFGVHMITLDDQHFGFGHQQVKFSIQSIVKVLSLTMAYRLRGEDLWKRVGVEPSGTPFNSLVQLEYDKGIPRNPMINAGAIVVCDVLLELLDDPEAEFLAFIRQICGNDQIDFSKRIAASEKAHGFRNGALVNLMKSFGNIHHDIEQVMDYYFKVCSIEMTCEELARSFLFLANDGVDPRTGQVITTESQSKRLNAIMQTCGFYDEAGEFSFKVGLPGKSGVGGGIVAVHPDQYVLAVWSPKLNAKGNSYRGVQFLEEFTTITQSSIF